MSGSHTSARGLLAWFAANHVAATLPNLDDGNQYMNHLLEWDIIKSPDIALRDGSLPVLGGPGLGITLDPDAVTRAAENHIRQVSKHG